MMAQKTIAACLLMLALTTSTYSQYIFNDEIRLPVTAVKDQQSTGTCWSFATVSFIEAEILRLKHIDIDLSEMYFARMVYSEKVQNYILRQGKANFGEGGLAHDVLRNIDKKGFLPQGAYSGLVNGENYYNHQSMVTNVQSVIDSLIETHHPGNNWQTTVDELLDAKLGAAPTSFVFEDKNFTPQSFAKSMGIEANNYVGITSLSHKPFNQYMVLDVPDNFSNGQFLNVDIDAMMAIINHSLEKGYTMVWDGDVSENGFSQYNGIAVLASLNMPKDSIFSNPFNEIKVDQTNRQQAFMSYQTTEDHLMHLVGRAKDQNGNTYYIIKNSWADRGAYKGFLYMSEAYVRMKTVAITVNKDVLGGKIKKLAN